MKLKITVHGVAYEVDVEVLDTGEGFPAASPLPIPSSRSYPGANFGTVAASPAAPSVAPGSGHRSVASPVAGTVLEVKCKEGDAVEENQVLFVLEAMKMKTSIAAPARGRVGEVLVAAGDAVQEGQPLVHYQ
jgi:biotin carboxyl carrier protein